MRTKQYAMTSLWIAAVAIVLSLPTHARAITFGEWAAGRWTDDIAPDSVDANDASIHSLADMDDYDWTTTPTTCLTLSSNQIASIETDAFNGLSNLSTLYLRYNQIASIEAGDFNGLSNLESLDLRYNQIASIEADAFNGLGNLLTLQLSSNQITSIEADAFNGLNNLSILQLSYNQIASIEADAFNGLGNLSCLYLSSNQIASIETDAFNGLSNLSYLSLGYNQIASIEANAFNGLSNLSYLKLSANRITSIEAGDFNGLSNLSTLNLEFNRITSIEAGAFSGLSNLQYLYLENNVSLTNLYLEGADFSSLSRFNVKGNTSITSVSLKDAVLTQTALGALMDGGYYYRYGIGELPGITELDLSGVDFVNITDLAPLHAMDDLTDLWLIEAENLGASDLDVLLDNLATMEGTADEGVLYLTQADFDAYNTAGGGLLAAWDAEPGHHVHIIPEPGTLALLAVGCMALSALLLRRRRVACVR